MKPLDGRSAPDRREPTGQPDARVPGKSGLGAASALEQLIRQERARMLHQPGEPPREEPTSDTAPAVSRA